MSPSPPGGPSSASVLSVTRIPGFAGTNGAKAPTNPASRMGPANVSRNARIVTPRSGASHNSPPGPLSLSSVNDGGSYREATLKTCEPEPTRCSAMPGRRTMAVVFGGTVRSSFTVPPSRLHETAITP